MKPKLAAQPIALLHCSRRLIVTALALCLVGAAGVADARSRVEEGASNDRKPHTLRGVLTSAHDTGEKSSERRRLNAEERSALHRDLRDAMRGAYPEQPAGRKKPR